MGRNEESLLGVMGELDVRDGGVEHGVRVGDVRSKEFWEGFRREVCVALLLGFYGLMMRASVRGRFEAGV